jgi:hypothetical protein
MVLNNPDSQNRGWFSELPPDPRVFGGFENQEEFSKPGDVLKTGGSSGNWGEFSELGGVLRTQGGSENRGEF